MSRKFLVPIVLPADPVVAMEAATKQYVDNAAPVLSWKAPVRCHSGITNNGFMSGLTGTYDGITLVDGDRILLKGQNTPSQNGIWIAHSGAWVRATDADTGSEMLGATVFVSEGTTGADTIWMCSTNAPITIDSTPLTFVPLAGSSVSEVEINASDPIGTNPSAELWVDSDAPPVMNVDDFRWNTAWGVVTSATRTTPSASTSATPIDTGISVTWTPVAGRRYSVMFEGLAVVSAAGNVCNINVQDPANLTLQGGGASPGVPNTGQSCIIVGYVDATSTTPLTFKVRHFATGTGTCYVYADASAPMRLYVEDQGPIAGALPAAPIASMAWIAPTLLNGWTNLGSGWQPVQYRMVGDVVQIRGLVNRGTAVPDTVATAIFALPVGFRTPYGEIFSVNAAGNNYGSQQVRINVLANGNVEVLTNASAVQNPHVYTSLSGIQFSVSP